VWTARQRNGVQEQHLANLPNMKWCEASMITWKKNARVAAVLHARNERSVALA
jgi:hypothetical protein